MDAGLIMGLATGVALTLIVVNYLKDTKKNSANNDSEESSGGGSGGSVTSTRPKK